MQVVVKKPITILLLLAVTLAIAALTTSITGKSYSKVDPIPFEDLRHLAHRLERKPMATTTLSIIVLPVIGNLLMFLPWGFLMFITLYSVERPTVQTYVLTILLGISFSTAIEAVQYFLPSRVADVNDVIWNSAGTLLGALLGHARLRLRFEFE
ncbi:MAG TPA: VanZ family protein [Thermoanaerobaculia bacterium]|nr:VanZ family protein [Thermoanaerobaculia bacterium]